ncbi:EndoU domain-containing protein [Elizabethkingia anophelis]|uniref:EndoU domain-containing protein n=1 Tax=Elizabethkingia anophelis TaxID=1117645 RepID=UPI00373487D5
MEYYYYIFSNPVDSKSLMKSELPQICKLKKDLYVIPMLTNSTQGEGPFNSIVDLRKKSIIYSKIQLQKHRERVAANKNVKEIKDFIGIPKESSYELSFIKAFHHINVGKIQKNEVKGVHFFNPDRIRILEIVDENKETGVYLAKISKYNEDTKKWVEKKELTHFFPNSWNLNRLFHELNYAYEHKIYEEGNIYLSRTSCGINVKLIIKGTEIMTIFPLLN